MNTIGNKCKQLNEDHACYFATNNSPHKKSPDLQPDFNIWMG